jgi:hypothetical protein
MVPGTPVPGGRRGTEIRAWPGRQTRYPVVAQRAECKPKKPPNDSRSGLVSIALPAAAIRAVLQQP